MIEYFPNRTYMYVYKLKDVNLESQFKAFS